MSLASATHFFSATTALVSPSGRHLIRWDILMDGTLDRSFTGTNKNLLYTRRTLGKRSLLLIGNYSNLQENSTELSIRGKLLNCVTGERSTANGSYKLRIAPDDFAMLLLEE